MSNFTKAQYETPFFVFLVVEYFPVVPSIIVSKPPKKRSIQDSQVWCSIPKCTEISFLKVFWRRQKKTPQIIALHWNVNISLSTPESRLILKGFLEKLVFNLRFGCKMKQHFQSFTDAEFCSWFLLRIPIP